MGNATLCSISEMTIEVCNYDLENLITPINIDCFEQLLIKTDFPVAERLYLTQGFREGFDLGYRGPAQRRNTASNIPFTVGNKEELFPMNITCNPQ